MSDTAVPNTSQPTPKPGDQATSLQTQLSEQELDRLHIRWILGKNRGQRDLLTKEQATQLIDSNRILWDQLSEIEQHTLINDPNLKNKTQEWMSGINKVEGIPGDLEEKEKIELFIDLVIEGLKLRIRSMVEDDLKKIENSQLVDEKMLLRLCYDRFTFEYGIDIEMLEKILKEQYLQNIRSPRN